MPDGDTSPYESDVNRKEDMKWRKKGKKEKESEKDKARNAPETKYKSILHTGNRGERRKEC